MQRNFEIIESFLTTGTVPSHPIYELIQQGCRQSLPEQIPIDILKRLYEETKKNLEPFKPLNEDLWIRIFGPTPIPDTVKVWLIVGAPKGCEAVVRLDADQNRHLIIDLGQICAYSNLVSRLLDIVFDFLTHELAHVLIGQKYRYSTKMPREQFLKQLAFDEGIAHFLSFEEDVLDVDWNSAAMQKRKTKAFETFTYYLEHAKELTFQDLKRANTGAFWDKFASIAGMFALVDYCQNDGNLENLLFDGPKLLSEFIEPEPPTEFRSAGGM